LASRPVTKKKKVPEGKGISISYGGNLFYIWGRANPIDIYWEETVGVGVKKKWGGVARGKFYREGVGGDLGAGRDGTLGGKGEGPRWGGGGWAAPRGRGGFLVALLGGSTEAGDAHTIQKEERYQNEKVHWDGPGGWPGDPVCFWRRGSREGRSGRKGEKGFWKNCSNSFQVEGISTKWDPGGATEKLSQQQPKTTGGLYHPFPQHRNGKNEWKG